MAAEPPRNTLRAIALLLLLSLNSLSSLHSLVANGLPVPPGTLVVALGLQVEFHE
ncbi:hypothetical protein GCM10010145_04740 [Streptomyces ruber]|uniref:Uncharacterized protein n=2 Tax=Streptomyces TaxID=1883 RepID=A0A918B721_9ACTN|nr:hypothetical protein [Streptomyces ruber]GGQ39998.1 hypothetical protein GCM10010145_04740 [Streptomyces ruber]